MARVTIEDCLLKVPNRFALTLLAVKRSRQLQRNSQPLLTNRIDENKPCVMSLREIAAGVVQPDLDIQQLLHGIVPEEKKRKRKRRRP
jgi:DNA-directed RNA polymerase subunit omega